MKRRWISGTVILVMLFVMIPITRVSAADVWTGNVDTSWYVASGTTFTINSAAQLAGLAQLVNDGTDNFSGNIVSLSTDIDLDHRQWTPIGQSLSNAFQGRFDGNDHVIRNLSIGTTSTPVNIQFAGLFGYCGASLSPSTVQDLGVVDVAIYTNYSSNYSRIGGVAGNLIGTMKDCYATGTVESRSDNSYLGGLIGQINPAAVSNCYADVDIVGMGSTSIDPANTTLYTQAGGLIGRSSNSASPSISNCFATGNIVCSGSARVGGLVGYFGSSGANGCSITNSYATGSTSAAAGTYTAVGGFVGFLVSGNIYSSYWNSTAGAALGIGLNQGESSSVTAMTASQMATDSFVTTLNSIAGSSVWKADSENKNNGYPLLDGVGAGIVSNHAPTALNVHVDGTVQLYQELTGVYVYSDADGDLEGATQIQWYRADDATGTNRAPISGATTAKYTLQAADIGKRIQFVVTPIASTGTLTGTAVSGSYSVAVEKADSTLTSVVSPVLSSKTDTTATLAAVTGYEYTVVTNNSSASSGIWQDSPTFSGLTSNTPYDFYQRAKETSLYKPSAVSAKLDVATDPSVLTGTAAITGVTSYGQTLTATLSSTNNTGVLSYRWTRGGEDIADASNSTYTLVASDVGSQISVVVTSSIETGSVSSSPTATILKAGSNPAMGITPVLLAGTDVSITLTTVPGYEYTIVGNGAAASSGTWQDSPIFTGLTANTPYDFYQRVKETATNYASSISAKLDVTTLPAALTGTASITGNSVYNEVLTASLNTTNNTGTLSYQWVRGTDDISGANSQNYTLVAADIGTRIRVRITSDVESGSVTSGQTAIVEKAACSTATGITPVLSSKTDTSVSLIDVAGYEYIAVSNGMSVSTGTWQDSELFTGLNSNTEYDFYQRVKETSTHKASDYSPKLDVKTDPSVLTGTASILGTLKFGETLTANLGATNNSGVLSYQWVRGGVDISGATDQNYTLVAADIGAQIRVRITSNIETGAIASDLSNAISKADAASPVAPELISKTKTDIILRGVSGYEYLVVADGVDISAGTWQDSNAFYGLTPNTPYDCYQRMKETATREGSSPSIRLDVTTSPYELTGTVNISGNAVVGETLTGALLTSNNTGILSCQWVRGSVNIPGADDLAYTLSAADIGYAIRLKITSSVETGTIISDATAVIQKQSSDPATGIAPVLFARKDTSITLVSVSGYEYAVVSDGSSLDAVIWQDSPIFSGLSPNTAYDCYQRVKETSTQKASAISPKLDAVTDIVTATPTPTRTPTPSATLTPTPSATPTTTPTAAATTTAAPTPPSSETSAAESAIPSDSKTSEEETKPGETTLTTETAPQTEATQNPGSKVAAAEKSKNPNAGSGDAWILPTVLGGLLVIGLILFFTGSKKWHKRNGSRRNR